MLSELLMHPDVPSEQEVLNQKDLKFGWDGCPLRKESLGSSWESTLTRRSSLCLVPGLCPGPQLQVQSCLPFPGKELPRKPGKSMPPPVFDGP